MDGHIFLGTTDAGEKQYLDLRYANRHGLIAGATGTGKTVSLQVLAEGFSKAGVPVFLADIKGDMSGICAKGAMQDFLTKRAAKVGYEGYAAEAMPVVFWDVFGKQGHPMRTTISEMGPLLVSRILDLNDTQEGVMNIAFKIADEEGLLLLDLKDLQELLKNMAERTDEISGAYGNVTKASIGAIQRDLLVLEEQGGEAFFGEPALDLFDLMRRTSGKGNINILTADKLVQTPRLYATFLLWLLSELFEELPEAGDIAQPKMVFFFDEAHLLFNDAPDALLDKIEQVVRLIRSKGVGVFFCTQTPTDVPETVLAQLGCRVQHALRAFTPKAQKAIKVAAATFRENPELNTEEILTELGIGEALTSSLGDKAVPSMVQHTFICPPVSLLGPVDGATKASVMQSSPVAGMYDRDVDRESAYEILKVRAEKAAKAAEAAQEEAEEAKAEKKKSGGGRQRQGIVEAAIKSVVRTIGSEVGRQIIRGILGSMRK